MQRKGERQTMTGKEYCRYIRTYSELEGLQRAHTVVYCAQTVPGGVLAQLLTVPQRYETAIDMALGAAQQNIVKIVRRLEAENKVVVSRGAGEVFV